MTKRQAFNEATRRWFVPNPAGGQALRVAFAFLGRKDHPMRYQVGSYDNTIGKSVIHGVSTNSWEDAFFNADQSAGDAVSSPSPPAPSSSSTTNRCPR